MLPNQLASILVALTSANIKKYYKKMKVAKVSKVS